MTWTHQVLRKQHETFRIIQRLLPAAFLNVFYSILQRPADAVQHQKKHFETNHGTENLFSRSICLDFFVGSPGFTANFVTSLPGLHGKATSLEHSTAF